MRFKKLELLGFKSFAEHTELVFEPGVTAVVGPNGCGKSNIADSIKWVLGEQSARELRGGRMEDLIFNGSDTRDPVNYAEVSLTVDNSEKKLPLDYAEVTISRRLFRSGESEYLLNRTPVRLKDIQELLMGTGIGTSAYSLFEQGRIEQIISARPEDRRAVFEEAAGITKFKSHKREALRKLEETEDNLSRVTDIIAEVKRQIQSLERQVRRAKAYQERWEELKRLEVKLAQRETAALDLQHQEKRAALELFRTESQALESRSRAQEDLLRNARATVAGAEEALSKAKEAWLSAKSRLETLRNNLEINRERIAEAQARQIEIRRASEEAGARSVQLEEQRKEVEQTVLRQEQERQEMQSRINDCLNRLDSCGKIIDEAQRLMAKTRERILEATGLQVQIKNQLAKVRQEAARLEARAGRLQSELQKVAVERQEASQGVESLGQSLTEGQTVLEQLESERKVAQDNLTATESLLNMVQQEVRGLEQEQTRCISQIEVLKSFVATHEGYSSGVKALLTAMDQGQLDRAGVTGVLAELLQVGQSEAAAADAALGPWAEAVVVESASVADRCREFLERTNAGRVLFFIQDRIPQDSGNSRVNELPGCPDAVRLFDRIGITPHLSPLLEFLLADMWLVPDRMQAVSVINPSVPPGFRIVTPAGEMYSAASVLVGPAPSEEGMLVGRLSRLQSLEVLVAHVEGKLEEAQQRLAAFQEQSKTQQEALQEVESRCTEKLQEIHRYETNLSSANTTLKKFEQEESLLRAEHSEAAAELEQVNAQVHQAEEGLAAKDQEIADLEAELQRAQETVAASIQTREQTSVELATATAELASFDQVAESRRASLLVLEQSLQAVREQAASQQQELTQLVERQADWEKSSADLEQAWSELESEIEQSQAKVNEEDAHRTQALEAARVQEEEFLVLRRELEQLQTRFHAQEMEQAQLAFQKEQVATRLQQVYKLDLNLEPAETEAAETEPVDDAALKAQIEELSEKVQRIGPVNLGSIEEEQELQTRYEYLTTQQADLLKAKDDLHEALTKINRTTRAMFRETFEAIHKEFQGTYKRLFGGGEARLVLMDEEDVLESGIEIIARPPGKPLQPISLLSGGEKALTTIALLFAIFRIKPSPFCLMDEIDAPLDESNIGRFTGVLREFLGDSQFIMITHNKKTISMADVMYGVTMQELGVSKIISVKFKEASNGNGNGHGNGAHVIPARLSDPPSN